MIYVLLILIYLASVIGAYFEIRRMFKNEYSILDPEFTEIVVMLFPLMNTMVALTYPVKMVGKLIKSKLKNKKRKDKILVRFFRLSK